MTNQPQEKELLQIKRDSVIPTTSRMKALFGYNENKSVNRELLNTDYVLDDIKELLLIFLYPSGICLC